jgi:hypothetical protein
MSKRKPGTPDGPQPLRLHPAEGPAGEQMTEQMIRAVLDGLDVELRKLPVPERRNLAIFLTARILNAAADDDLIQAVGMLEMLKSDMLSPNWDDDDLDDTFDEEDEDDGLFDPDDEDEGAP